MHSCISLGQNGNWENFKMTFRAMPMPTFCEASTFSLGSSGVNLISPSRKILTGTLMTARLLNNSSPRSFLILMTSPWYVTDVAYIKCELDWFPCWVSTTYPPVCLDLQILLQEIQQYGKWLNNLVIVFNVRVLFVFFSQCFLFDPVNKEFSTRYVHVL